MKVLSRTQPIIPGASIGGISIGENAREVVDWFNQMDLTICQKPFENFGRNYSEWTVSSWGLLFVEEDDKIVRVSCFPGYDGSYNRIFHPGMSVKQIVNASTKQQFIHGTLVLDGEFGAFFEVPEVYEGRQYDDIDTVGQLPDEMVLQQLTVMDRNWWR